MAVGMNQGESDRSTEEAGRVKEGGNRDDIADAKDNNMILENSNELEDDDMPDIASMLSGNLLAKRIGFYRPAEEESQNEEIQQEQQSAGYSSQKNYYQYQQHQQHQQHQQQHQQYTWIMETGRGESPSSKNSHPSYANYPHQFFQQPFMNPATTLPLHFQHLLAASSLLWPTTNNSHYPRNNSVPLSPATFPYLAFPHFAAAAAAVASQNGKKCSNCGATSTPSWRRCPAGKNLLCNACGLYQKLHGRRRPFKVADDGSIRVQRTAVNNTKAEETEEVPKICSNCVTTDTPLWRKVDGQQCCNACALFHRTHGYHRQSSRESTSALDNGEPIDENLLTFTANASTTTPDSFSSLNP